MVVRRSVILKPARGYVDGKYIGEVRESISGVDDTKRRGNKNGNTTKPTGKRGQGGQAGTGGRRSGASGNAGGGNVGDRADNFGNTIAPPQNKRGGGRTGDKRGGAAGGVGRTGAGGRRKPSGGQADGNVLGQPFDPRAGAANGNSTGGNRQRGAGGGGNAGNTGNRPPRTSNREGGRADGRSSNRGPKPDRNAANAGNGETMGVSVDGNSGVPQLAGGPERPPNSRGRSNSPRRGPRQDRGPRPPRLANDAGDTAQPTFNADGSAAPATGEARPPREPGESREPREQRGLRRGRTRTQSTRGGQRPPREQSPIIGEDGNVISAAERPPRLNSDGTPRIDRGTNSNRRGRNPRQGRNDRSGQNRNQNPREQKEPRDSQDVQIEERFFVPQVKLAIGVDGEAIIGSDGNNVRAKNRQPPASSNARKNRGGKKTPFRQSAPRAPAGPIDEDNIGNMVGNPSSRGNRFATPSEITDQRRQSEETKSGQFAEAIATKQVVKRERLHKIMAQSGLGSRRDMELMITAGRIMVNGIVAGAGTQVSEGDVVMVDQRPIRLRFTAEIPRVMLYHKPDGEIVTTNDPGNRITVFDNLPRVESGKWIAIGRLDISTSGLLIFTTNGELANRMMHPRFEVEREYAVRILGELTQEQTQTLLDGVRIDDAAIAAARARAGLPAYDDEDADDLDENSEHEKDNLSAADRPARFDSIEARGGDGANHWYQVVIKEGRNREVRKMFESQGLIVSRLLRTRFGKIELPPRLGRGKMVELEAGQVKALLNWAGVKIEGITDGVGNNKGRDRNPREGAKAGEAREPREAQSAKPQREPREQKEPREPREQRESRPQREARPPRNDQSSRAAKNTDEVEILSGAPPVLPAGADFSDDFEIPDSMPVKAPAKKPRSSKVKAFQTVAAPEALAVPVASGTIEAPATIETDADAKPKAAKRAPRTSNKTKTGAEVETTADVPPPTAPEAPVLTAKAKPAAKRAKAPAADLVATAVAKPASRAKKPKAEAAKAAEANGNLAKDSPKSAAEIDHSDDDIGNR